MVPRQHITPQPEVIRAILLDDSPWEEAHWAMLAKVSCSAVRKKTAPEQERRCFRGEKARLSLRCCFHKTTGGGLATSGRP